MRLGCWLLPPEVLAECMPLAPTGSRSPSFAEFRSSRRLRGALRGAVGRQDGPGAPGAAGLRDGQLLGRKGSWRVRLLLLGW